jgi:hypothetical protein
MMGEDSAFTSRRQALTSMARSWPHGLVAFLKVLFYRSGTGSSDSLKGLNFLNKVHP